MTTRHLRTLKLAGDLFFWRVDHAHHLEPDACAEVFSAFRSGFRKSPVRVRFSDAEQRGSGFPSQSGVVYDSRPPGWSVNLHQPRTARLLIELALARGWTPLSATREYIIPDGFQLLRDNPDALVPYLLPSSNLRGKDSPA
jgi:hypothetical protein